MENLTEKYKKELTGQSNWTERRLNEYKADQKKCAEDIEPTTVEKAQYVLENYYGINATITTYNNEDSIIVSSWNNELTDSIDVYMTKKQIEDFAIQYDEKNSKQRHIKKYENWINDRQLLIKEVRKDRQAVIDLLPKNTSHIKKYENCEYMSNTELKELYNKIGKARNNKETDEELCDIAYAVGYYYYTEWEDETDYEYEEIKSRFIPIK
jgi:hypothetical protein